MDLQNSHPHIWDVIRKPAYASYGDASHSNSDFLKDVEVLATVEEDVNDHGVSWPEFEVKYQYYEWLDKKRSPEIARWDQVLSQASVYVFDPEPIRERFEDDWRYVFNRRLGGADYSTWWLKNEIANEAILSMPQIWLHLLDIEEGMAVRHLGSPKRAIDAINVVLKLCNASFVNLRRVSLESQHVFRQAANRRPRILRIDDATEREPWKITGAELARTIAPPVILDEGHCRDLAVLEEGRTVHRNRLEKGAGIGGLPDHVPGRIELARSAKDQRLQIADVAAGKARDLYSVKGIAGLCEVFENVTVNGVSQKVSAARQRVVRNNPFLT